MSSSIDPIDPIETILKNQFITSCEKNETIRNQIKNTFKSNIQNIKYHILWLFFHSFSFAYPEFPSEEYKIETANFISYIIPKNLEGCVNCQNDYKDYLGKQNIFRIVSSRENLSRFFVDLHNYINVSKFNKNSRMSDLDRCNIVINNCVKIDTPVLFEYDDVKNNYSQIDFISLLYEKYNINMFILIETQCLSSFYEKFNACKFNINNKSFNINISIS